MAKECSALSFETYVVEESRQVDGARMEALAQPSNAGVKEVIDAIKDVSGKVVDSAMPTTVPQSSAPTTKEKKYKGKNSEVSPSPTAFNTTDSSNEPGANLSSPSVEAVVPHILAMQDTLNQLLSMQKEMQKQISVLVVVLVTKEGRRLEITSLITNSLNKDLPAILEKIVKKEIVAIVPTVARTITPIVEKTISSAIIETFQRGVGDKALNQVEKSINSKLEATVARKIQVQFQTSGKQALQDALKSNLEASVVPAFEMSCKAMFDQVDSTFQKEWLSMTAIQQQFESTHSPLALALRDTTSATNAVEDGEVSTRSGLIPTNTTSYS
uniref:Enhancer of mRNA-decapping protein 4 n=1 Tax=Vitis vinifera TaxID=29760 RepID=F6H690_VITVI